MNRTCARTQTGDVLGRTTLLEIFVKPIFKEHLGVM